MPHYAQTLIEVGATRWQPGEVVPDDLPGLEDLAAHGSVSEEKFVRTVQVDAQNRIIGDAHVEAFAGDFTGEQIEDPAVDTPSLGRPGDDAQVAHAAQHDSGEASA